MKVRVLITISLLFILSHFCAQQKKIDSLKSLLEFPLNDKDIPVLIELSNAYTFHNYDSAIKYANLGIQTSEKNGKKPDQGFSVSLGNVYFEKGEYDKALNYYIEAEKQGKLLGDLKSLVLINGNIGLIYLEQNLLEKAKIQFESALEIAKENRFQHLIAGNTNYLGRLFYAANQKDEAMVKFKEALLLAKELNKTDLYYECVNNIAIIHQETGHYNDALDYFGQYLEFVKQNNESRGLSAAYHNIALVYKDMKNIVNTITYLDSSVTAAKSVRAFQDLIEIYSTYTEIFTLSNNYEKAFETFKLQFAAKDSLIQQTRDKQFIEMSTKYQSEKKESENKFLKATGEKQKAITAAISIVLLLVAVLAFFIFRSYRIKQKANKLLSAQNTEIIAQKGIIENKQKEILDSIAYAKRLQDAILPPSNLIEQYFPNSFIIYKPKDIVAGDFYWMEQKNDHIFIAAADSTGHGVPGAMVSVICSGALSRAVKEFGIFDPGKILDKTRELIIETFEKSERDVKDGMDISLISLNTKSGEIQWAGAFNRLWYTRENTILEIIPDKQPIGKTEDPKAFTTHTIIPQKGDCFFLFTDGYADQFGGPDGKKLKYKKFKEIIHSKTEGTMYQQKQNLEEALILWKGLHEQIDDICVIGLKI